MSEDKKNILIVEDEILIASQIKIALIKHGFNFAGIAISYNSAETILKIKVVDLVLIDITLSGVKTGLELAEFINENYGIPFLFLTSYNDAKTLKKIKSLNPVGYINKPINEATLLMNLDLFFNGKEDKKSRIINITVGTVTHNINVSELLYAESDHVYVKLFFATKKLLLRISLKSLLQLLPEHSLLQISRGLAVNPEFIEQNASTKVKVAAKEFKVSKSFKDDFLLQISNIK
jgi:DNA-binding LytR/AlgR family response regulator